MKCLWNNVDLGWRAGDIWTMTRDAIAIAGTLDTKVSFEFNGVKVNVTKSSTIELVADKTILAVKQKQMSVYGEGW